MTFNCDWIWEKPASTHTTRRHTFYNQRIAVHILTNNSGKYWSWKLPGLLLLWLVSQACQTSMSARDRVAFKWLYIPLASRESAVIHHTTGWWVWPWIYLVCVICVGGNGINEYHLAGFSEDVAFALNFMATLPLTLSPFRSDTGICYASKKLSKIVGNSDSYSSNSWWIDRL